jgi:hypothetical protein
MIHAPDNRGIRTRQRALSMAVPRIRGLNRYLTKSGCSPGDRFRPCGMVMCG